MEWHRVSTTTGMFLLTFFAAGSIVAQGANSPQTVCPKIRECPKKACGKGQYQQGEILVKFKKDVSKEAIEGVNKSVGTEVIKHFHHIGAYLLKLPAGMEVKDGIKVYQGQPEVEYAEPNYKVSTDPVIK
ncbi:MAG: hypothetical protein V1736_03180 [Pseudomonadota bacterium]